MNVVDWVILIFILFGGLIGFKRGFTKSLVSCLGFISIVVLAFLLKNPLSVLFYENLPFFKFGGILKGITSLNILLYEVIAFLIVLAVLSFILKIITLATSIFEGILTATVVLGIPSKILGAIVGFIENYIITFILLFILTLPMFGVEMVHESKWGNYILHNTPILSGMVEKTINVIDDFVSLKEKYKTATNSNQFNLETLDLFLHYHIIEIDSVEKLIEKDKLEIDGIENLLNKYRKE